MNTMMRLIPSRSKRSEAKPGSRLVGRDGVVQSLALTRLLTLGTAHQLSNELPFTANFPLKFPRAS